MQKALEKKLRLSKETLRELVPQELGQVAGGGRSCGATGCGCTGGITTISNSGSCGLGPTDTNTTVGWCNTIMPI